ncbi:NAD(P)-binding protein [Dendrothele bispora CBS 962.96]|uniref:NAD(P)-binding protein n=1 Tax=Dendrothele bispora (strain CBS 962.96) TaxID=1314807 RepID=A0A4S8LXU2_DENBC|nr:NAD(P)-binding protein [Dendrothele bispora CBS 962.96]
MPAIADELLYEHAERVKNKIVLITGAATGIGKATATKFASHGAHVLIADMNLPAAERTAREMKTAGSQVVAIKCDVTVWEDVLAAYEFAIEKFGVVDIVIANAGIGESAMLGELQVDSNGKFVKPSTKTVDVNLIGVLYTVHLAQHYLLLNRPDQTSLKAVVLLGSIASWWALRGAQYTATKFAVLGLMRSLDPSFTERGIRIAAIHPWFADTDIVPYELKVGMAGIPLVPVPRIAGAIFHAASNPDPSTSGSSYWCHPGPVFRIPREEFKFGVYEMIDKEANAMFE